MAAHLLEHQAKVIELLAQHEEAAAALYMTFADEFPDKKEFWTVLHLEELNHAAWIRRLRPKIEEGLVTFSEERFNIKTIQTSLDYLTELLSKAKNQRSPLTEALSVALDIEESLIERKFYEVYEADSEELKQLLRSLRDAFIEHRDRLKQALDKTHNFL